MSTGNNGGGELLPPWLPGQSGNPRGSSRKSRDFYAVRNALRKLLAEDAPPHIVEGVRQILGVDAIEGAFADLVAARLLGYSLSKNAAISLAAIREIMANEPKELIVHTGTEIIPELDDDAETAAEIQREMEAAGLAT